jgi:HEAT repeat protein
MGHTFFQRFTINFLADQIMGVFQLENIEQTRKNRFLDLAHKKFGKSKKAETRALEEALDQWMQHENESNELSSLIEDLKHDDSAVSRKRAAFKLGNYNNRYAVNALVKALNDNDIHVRRSATASLGKIGDDKSIKHLITLLGNEDSNIKSSAEGYLSYLGETALEPLYSARWSRNKDVRARSATAIGSIASKWQVSTIIDVLCSFMDDEEDMIRWRAATALGDVGVGSSKSIKTLLDSLNDRDLRVRQNALKSLGNIGDEETIIPLIKFKEDNDPRIKEIAEESLEKVIDRVVNS